MRFLSQQQIQEFRGDMDACSSDRKNTERQEVLIERIVNAAFQVSLEKALEDILAKSVGA